MTQFGLPAEERTMSVDGRIEPIPGMGVCDFCTCTPVIAAFPCGTVMIETPLGAHATNDPWGACEYCYALIEADDHQGLLERSLGSVIVHEGEMPEGERVFFRATIGALHEAFFSARNGEPELL